MSTRILTRWHSLTKDLDLTPPPTELAEAATLPPPDVDPTQTPKRCEIEGEMAEGVGFEPTDTSLHHSISNRAP